MGVLPSLLSVLTSMSLLVIGGLRVIDGGLSIGMLAAFQLLMQSFQRPVNRLVQFASTLQNLQGNMQRLDDVLDNVVDPQLEVRIQNSGVEGARRQETGDRRQETGDGENPQSLAPSSPIPHPPIPCHRLQGYIDLKDINFGYSPLEPPLIANFNLSIKPGQRVAFVGGSGSGKSTLAKVIAGLYEAWSGEICFDGIPRSRIPRSVLTNSIAVVEQDILLFEGTIRENLTLWDTTVPDRALRRACRDAAIEEIILSIPCGYDADLLEGATNLSGGQRQRLEIARALVNNPSIVIMDEATSALDTETEKIIDQNLRRRGCACLIVAHRLSTIRDADEIIVLDRGEVVQRGTHEALWRQEGYYSNLIRSEGGVLSNN